MPGASRADRPAAWFTYHVYYKAPDWIGPVVAKAMGIPYLIAEASIAGKRERGPHALGHAGALAAVRAADVIFTINPADREALEPLVDGHVRLVDLPAFVDTAAYRRLAEQHGRLRREVAYRHKLETGHLWLLTVAMMRKGDKLASYRVLGEALEQVLDLYWQLIVVGDGAARDDVVRALAPLGEDRVRFVGAQGETQLASYYGAADLCVWPAINEAYGMALLEAQAAGLPVVAGASGGVPSIVEAGITGLLTPPGDAKAFAPRAAKSDRDSQAPRRHGAGRLRENAPAPRSFRRHRASSTARSNKRSRSSGPAADAMAPAGIAAPRTQPPGPPSGVCKGRTDLPLSAAGRLAVAGWQLPREVEGFAWVTSPLARARETAALLGHGDAAVDARLREMSFGEWEGRRLVEIRKCARPGHAGTGGSRSRFLRSRRGKPARGSAAAGALPAGDRASGGVDRLAVTHKAVIRALYAPASGWPMLGQPPQRLAEFALHLFAVAADDIAHALGAEPAA